MATRVRFDKDYYGIMGLAPTASEEEIRKAYRRLALQWHPDRNRGDARAAERFKEISEAYAVLIDPAKRTDYDRARAMGATPHFGGTREDLFRDLFANPRASAVFEDLAREFERMGLRIDRHSFHQTLFGGRTVVSGGVVVITPLTPVLTALRLVRAALRGRAQPPADVAAPPGSSSLFALLGQLGRRLFGLPAAPPDAVILPLRVTRAEAAQGGRKRVVVEGSGGRDDLLVTVPPGTRAGTRLRLRGKGRPGAGGARGDLYLTVEVADAD
ncbi:MAG TPA: DnaJ domain-containing protein [Methylomirabilota bacterium]|jgi:DnaJ-class molecular chaperone